MRNHPYTIPTEGCRLIIKERERQIEVLKYDEEHDKQHNDGELIDLASRYLDHADTFNKDIIKNLIKAGALIVAEIDRLLLLEREKNERKTHSS